MFSVCFSLGSPGANKKPKVKVEILKRFSLKYYLDFRLESGFSISKPLESHLIKFAVIVIF
jgi:hypothetical protein